MRQQEEKRQQNEQPSVRIRAVENNNGEARIGSLDISYTRPTHGDLSQITMPKYNLDKSNDLYLTMDLKTSNPVTLNNFINKIIDTADIKKFNASFEEDLFGKQYLKFDVESSYFNMSGSKDPFSSKISLISDSLNFEFKSPILDNLMGANVRLIRQGSETIIAPSITPIKNIEVGIGATINNQQIETITTELAPGLLFKTVRLTPTKDSTTLTNSVYRSTLEFNENNSLGMPASEISITTDPILGGFVGGKLNKPLESGKLSINGLYGQNTVGKERSFELGLGTEWKRLGDNSLEIKYQSNIKDETTSGDKTIRFYYEKRW